MNERDNFNQPPEQNINTAGNNQLPQNRPVYDSFMYEPIGFEDYVRMTDAEMRAEAEAKEKALHSRRERTIIILFVILVITTAVIGMAGLFLDIITSGKRIGNRAPSASVVIFQNKKPEGANDPSNFVDENGRYTTEGAAAAVRNSIVEIYTYSQPDHSDRPGTGSGIVLTGDGYIVTNAHVLRSDGYHDVHTAEGKIYPARVVGRDTKTDIAVIKVSGAEFAPAVLGDSDEVMVGEQVIAVGNPAGLSNTVTDGIVSAVGRMIRSDSTGFRMSCIQTNADISPGNSGGALVNMYGQVIGITSSKYVSDDYEGLGFAITINEAKPIVEELINQGFISGRFRIGIQLIDMGSSAKNQLIEDDLGFPLPAGFEGIYITSIFEDCDISNTALKAGDFITAIDGTPIKTYDELYETISKSYGAGDLVPATCAHLSKDGAVDYYEIEFRLMEDTSGDY